MPHITVLVSNDLVHDQRVRKVCASLEGMGFSLTLIGRELPGSLPIKRNYPCHRMNLLFKSGVLFYAELQIRLLIKLLFQKTDIILANDLDTLLPAFIAAKLRSKEVVYDSHEYFTEAAGLADNAFAKSVWLMVEKWIFPKLKRVYTVNESIASIYRNQYKVPVRVVRNIPQAKPLPPLKTRAELGLPEEKKIVLLQGAFIDPDRGAFEVAQAMKLLPDNIMFLLIGAGEEWHKVSEYRTEQHLEDKIMILPKQSFDDLRQYTMNSDLGLSVDKDLYLNYRLSLPNKLFDYIHAEIPVLISPLPELKRVMSDFEIGMEIENHNPEHIAEKLNEALNSDRIPLWKENLKKAAKHYTWENEEKVLQAIYGDLIKF
jgi:glycosyltransferase involved in cell wall biosynthesis